MPSVNRAILIGHLGRDPEMRYTQEGTAIANVSIATTETWKNKAGEKQEATEWHRVVFFGKLAEIAGEYLKKGSLVYVEGQLRTRKWQNKDGVDQYTTEINAREMKMLGGKPDKPADSTTYAQASQSAAKPGGSIADMEDDIPF